MGKKRKKRYRTRTIRSRGEAKKQTERRRGSIIAPKRWRRKETLAGQ